MCLRRWTANQNQKSTSSYKLSDSMCNLHRTERAKWDCQLFGVLHCTQKQKIFSFWYLFVTQTRVYLVKPVCQLTNWLEDSSIYEPKFTKKLTLCVCVAFLTFRCLRFALPFVAFCWWLKPQRTTEVVSLNQTVLVDQIVSEGTSSWLYIPLSWSSAHLISQDGNGKSRISSDHLCRWQG